MHWLAAILGLALIVLILWDGFETIVLPRRVTRKVRLTRLFYRLLWKLWSAVARKLPRDKTREACLGLFGPLSLLLLMVFWGVGLVAGFALVFWSLGGELNAPGGVINFGTDLYLSGTSFITLGLGDVTPASPRARVLVVVEAATGFGFLALVIGYLPVIYQAFSRREGNISLLDARAGSPPSLMEMLHRFAAAGAMRNLDEFFRDWERWAADVLESHISYPVLCYFRSQHSNQSWLAALTTVLDAASTAIAGFDGVPHWQAELTFAMARHAVVDMAQILNTPPRAPARDRLPHQDFLALWEALAADGVALREPRAFERKLGDLRRMYEPYVDSMSAYLMLTVPNWTRPARVIDNWRTSAWERASTLSAESVFDRGDEEHSV